MIEHLESSCGDTHQTTVVSALTVVCAKWTGNTGYEEDTPDSSSHTPMAHWDPTAKSGCINEKGMLTCIWDSQAISEGMINKPVGHKTQLILFYGTFAGNVLGRKFKPTGHFSYTEAWL